MFPFFFSTYILRYEDNLSKQNIFAKYIFNT
jgi:hypothetical protein